MTLTPEEVLAQLRTRGFDKGFQQTPLREFKGKLDSIGGEMTEFVPSRLRVIFGFSEVNVINSTEPYPFPIAQITMMQSTREKSAWGVFGTSVDKIINAGIAEDAPPEQLRGVDCLVTKVLHMKMTGGHMMWDRDRGEETPRECWELIGIEGESAPATVTAEPTATAKTKEASSTNRALALLDGKTEQEWYVVVFQDPAVKADPTLVNSIIQRTFLPPLEEIGTISKDADGKYTVTKEG